MDYVANGHTGKSNNMSHDYKRTTQSLESPEEKLKEMKVFDRVKKGREFVVENPVKGVAIAVVAGALVGSVLTFSLHRTRNS